MHLAADRTHVEGTHLRALLETVAGHRAGDFSHDVAHCRIVGAQDRHAIERHAMQEIDEGLLQVGEVVPVGLHVVGIDIRDDRHDGQQVQERGVRLVGLHHDVVAAAKLRVGAGAVEAPADDEGRIESGSRQHARHQARRRGLAVRAGNGDALLEPHQFSQHQGARHHGNFLLARGHYLGVVRLDRRRGHDRIGAVDVRCRVADARRDAQPLESLQRCAVRQVRARNTVAQVEQHLGDAAHARAADTDKMDVTNRVLH